MKLKTNASICCLHNKNKRRAHLWNTSSLLTISSWSFVLRFSFSNLWNCNERKKANFIMKKNSRRRKKNAVKVKPEFLKNAKVFAFTCECLIKFPFKSKIKILKTIIFCYTHFHQYCLWTSCLYQMSYKYIFLLHETHR